MDVNAYLVGVIPPRPPRAVAVLRDPFEFAMELYSRPAAVAALFGAEPAGAKGKESARNSRCEALLRDNAASLKPFLSRSSAAMAGPSSEVGLKGASPQVATNKCINYLCYLLPWLLHAP